MVYFLGRDVKVAICTESDDKAIVQAAGSPDEAQVGTDTSGDIIEFLWAAIAKLTELWDVRAVYRLG